MEGKSFPLEPVEDSDSPRAHYALLHEAEQRPWHPSLLTMAVVLLPRTLSGVAHWSLESVAVVPPAYAEVVSCPAGILDHVVAPQSQPIQEQIHSVFPAARPLALGTLYCLVWEMSLRSTYGMSGDPIRVSHSPQKCTLGGAAAVHWIGEEMWFAGLHGW